MVGFPKDGNTAEALAQGVLSGLFSAPLPSSSSSRKKKGKKEVTTNTSPRSPKSISAADPRAQTADTPGGNYNKRSPVAAAAAVTIDVKPVVDSNEKASKNTTTSTTFTHGSTGALRRASQPPESCSLSRDGLRTPEAPQSSLVAVAHDAPISEGNNRTSTRNSSGVASAVTVTATTTARNSAGVGTNVDVDTNTDNTMDVETPPASVSLASSGESVVKEEWAGEKGDEAAEADDRESRTDKRLQLKAKVIDVSETDSEVNGEASEEEEEEQEGDEGPAARGVGTESDCATTSASRMRGVSSMGDRALKYGFGNGGQFTLKVRAQTQYLDSIQFADDASNFHVLHAESLCASERGGH